MERMSTLRSVSERLRRVESTTLTPGGRTDVEADLVCAVDRASDDLRVAQAQATLLGHHSMAMRLQRCHRILTHKDESGEYEQLDPRGNRGTIIKRALSQLHEVRRALEGPPEHRGRLLPSVLGAIGELENLE
jgi:hypothetical protein